MPNICNITIAGHLGRDAETKTVGDQPVVEWSMAYTHKAKDTETTTWFRCQYWGQRAAKVAQYLTKGKAVLVIGGMYEREYQAKDGTTKRSLEVRVETLTLLGDGKREADAAPTPPNGGRPTKPAPAAASDGGESPPF
jgi:single-strand DNA-binding protein